MYDADGAYLAVLYADFFPRKGKQGGAWMTQYQGQWIDRKGENVRPHVSIVMNLTKPTPEKPALLTLGEVETFLHEFGHALHGIFANTRFESLSGTNVWWDFVELPSQFMENYAVEKDFLSTFAFPLQDRRAAARQAHTRHSEEPQLHGCVLMPAPSELRPARHGILHKARTLCRRHRGVREKAWAKAQVTPQLPDTCMTVQFSHIMAGGYAAGYYS